MRISYELRRRLREAGLEGIIVTHDERRVWAGAINLLIGALRDNEMLLEEILWLGATGVVVDAMGESSNNMSALDDLRMHAESGLTNDALEYEFDRFHDLVGPGGLLS